MKTTLSILIVIIFIQTSVQATTNFWRGATVLSGDCTNGFAKVVWDNGQTYEGYFEKHQPHGYAKVIEPQSRLGHITFGSYIHGQKDGIWITRPPNEARIISIDQFANGKKTGNSFNVWNDGSIIQMKAGSVDDLFSDEPTDDSMLVLLPDGNLDGDYLYQLKVNLDTNSQTGVYIPQDLSECFVELDKMLHPELVAKLKNDTAKDLPLFEYHMGLGMWLRNNWGLWKGSHLAEWFKNKGITHPDNMSGIIYRSYTRHLQDKPINLEEQINDYKKLYEEQENSHNNKAIVE